MPGAVARRLRCEVVDRRGVQSADLLQPHRLRRSRRRPPHVLELAVCLLCSVVGLGQRQSAGMVFSQRAWPTPVRTCQAGVSVSTTLLLQLRVFHDAGDKADSTIRTNFLKHSLGNRFRLSLANLRRLRAIFGPSLGPLGTTIEPSSVYVESISCRCTLPSDDHAARKVGAQQRVANLRVFPLYVPWLRWFSTVIIWGPAWGYLGVPLGSVLGTYSARVHHRE